MLVHLHTRSIGEETSRHEKRKEMRSENHAWKKKMKSPIVESWINKV